MTMHLLEVKNDNSTVGELFFLSSSDYCQM